MKSENYQKLGKLPEITIYTCLEGYIIEDKVEATLGIDYHSVTF
mgnify:FL=1